ncbi:hypothetical protein KUCAC02_022849, partial [Chaenocephalus aceratus]
SGDLWVCAGAISYTRAHGNQTRSGRLKSTFWSTAQSKNMLESKREGEGTRQVRPSGEVTEIIVSALEVIVICSWSLSIVMGHLP